MTRRIFLDGDEVIQDDEVRPDDVHRRELLHEPKPPPEAWPAVLPADPGRSITEIAPRHRMAVFQLACVKDGVAFYKRMTEWK